jgi:hypothetical protein
MFHLLTSTSIFLDVGSGNLCQASGRPIYELIPLVDDRERNPREKRPIPEDFSEQMHIKRRKIKQQLDAWKVER